MRVVLSPLLGLALFGCDDDRSPSPARHSSSSTGPIDDCASYTSCTPAPDEQEGQKLVLGTGKSCFSAALDGSQLPIIAGPQGGFHVWLALQSSGLDHDLLLSLRLFVEEKPVGLSDPIERTLAMCPIERGWAEIPKVFGYLDATGPIAANALVGKRLVVAASLVDPQGRMASATGEILLGEIQLDAAHGNIK